MDAGDSDAQTAAHSRHRNDGRKPAAAVLCQKRTEIRRQLFGDVDDGKLGIRQTPDDGLGFLRIGVFIGILKDFSDS